jgi:hypothetical protein
LVPDIRRQTGWSEQIVERVQKSIREQLEQMIE